MTDDIGYADLITRLRRNDSAARAHVDEIIRKSPSEFFRFATEFCLSANGLEDISLSVFLFKKSAESGTREELLRWIADAWGSLGHGARLFVVNAAIDPSEVLSTRFLELLFYAESESPFQDIERFRILTGLGATWPERACEEEIVSMLAFLRKRQLDNDLAARIRDFEQRFHLARKSRQQGCE